MYLFELHQGSPDPKLFRAVRGTTPPTQGGPGRWRQPCRPLRHLVARCGTAPWDPAVLSSADVWGCGASYLKPRGKANGQSLAASTWRGSRLARSEAPLHPAQSPSSQPSVQSGPGRAESSHPGRGRGPTICLGVRAPVAGTPITATHPREGHYHKCCLFTFRWPPPAPRDPVLNPKPR